MGKEIESTMRWKLDITDLKKNIQDANRSIKLANSEFKESTAKLDKWSTSCDGLNAKVKQLHTTLGAQKTILNNLENQYRVVSEEQGASSKAAQELEIRINNQKATIGKTEKQLGDYSEKLKIVEQANQTADSALGKLTKTINEQESYLEQLKKEYQETSLEQGKGSSAAKELETQIGTLSKELSQNKEKLKDAAFAGDDLSDALDDAGESASRSEGGFTILKGAIASLAADAIRAAIDGFKDLATESERASASFSASTGTSTEKMKAYNAQMKELYKNNYGESFDDIAESMAEVKKQTNEIDPSKLKDLTKNGIALRDTFGWDMQESMRAVKMLMDQFGISSEEAFNLLAQGAQNGLDKNGDLLDSINEYGVHYQQMGYSAEEFFNSLENGTLAGTFSVDKLGDAMKEFGIRTKDTATTTSEGFELLGLDADKMRTAFSKGGESARRATDETINALFSMDDQVKQNQAGVDLFGTMWEDLGKDGVQSLMMVNGQADKTKKTMQEINNVKYSDIGSQFTELGRSIKTDLLMPVAEKLLPVVKGGVQWTIQNLPTIIPIVETVGTALAAAFAIKTIAGFKDDIVHAGEALFDLGDKVPGVGSAMSSLGASIAANPWIALAAAVAGVTLAIGALVVKSIAENDQHRKNMDEINNEIKAREDLKKQQEEQLATNLGEIENTQSLYKELQGLVDVNGRVKDKYESRASFIVNELNKALGTEMTLNEGVISGYEGLSGSINDMLAKKRAEIILEAQLPAYKEAVTKSIEAQTKANELSAEISANNSEAKSLEIDLLKKYGEGWQTSYEAMSSSLGQQWSQLKADTYNKETEYNKQNELLKGYHEDIDGYELNSMRIQSGKPEQIAKIETDVIASKGQSYSDQKKMLAAQIEFENGSLLELKRKYKETGDESLLEMIKSKEAKITNMQEELNGLNSTIEEKKPSILSKFADIATSSIASLDKKDEAKKKGSENANSYGSGAASEKKNVYNKGAGIAGLLLSALGSETGEAYNIGKNYSIGLQNGTYAIDIFALGKDIGNALKRGTKEALDEHSPSKEGDKIGDFYIQGIGGGVKKNMHKVLDPIKEMGKNMLIETKEIAGRAASAISEINSPNASIGISKTTEGAGAVISSTQPAAVFNQYNYSPKALDRYEIRRNTKDLLRQIKGKG